MCRRLTTADFIKKATACHGDKYDYTKTIYKTNKDSVVIACKKHGEFSRVASDHLRNSGCPKCSKGSNLTREVFIQKAQDRHGFGTYDYSKSVVVGSLKKVEIVCPKHGSFFQTATTHLNVSGCPKCGNQDKYYTQESFIEKVKEVHGGFYLYDTVNYVGAYGKILIGCPEHGYFEQTARQHIRGKRCTKCAGNEKITYDSFMEKSISIHGERYDYSMVSEIKNRSTKVLILCKSHGPFMQAAAEHYSGSGCPQCARDAQEKVGFRRSTWIGIQKKRKATLYFIKCLINGEHFHKIGITYNSIGTRFSAANIKVTPVRLFQSEDAGLIYDLEKICHREFKNFQYVPQHLKEGFTECFRFHDESLVCEKIENLFQNFKDK